MRHLGWKELQKTGREKVERVQDSLNDELEQDQKKRVNKK